MADRESSAKLAACIICRDSEATIVDCIKSIAKFCDFLNITDTGSTDKTIQLINRTCKKIKLPYLLTEFEWVDDFAVARNFNFDQLPADYDWMLWIDSDDTIEGVEDGLRKLIGGAREEVGAIWLPYHYSHDEYNNCTTLFVRERLLRRSVGWKWQSRVHETVAPQSETAMVKDHSNWMLHKHVGGRADRSERNFRLLSKMIEEDPKNKRVWLYLGHQHFATGKHKEAAEWYLKFGEDEEAVPVERYQALTYAARALRGLGMPKNAIAADLTALDLYPNWADAYVGLCLSYVAGGQLDKAIYWGEEAKTKEMPEEVIFINPLDYTFNVYLGLQEAYAKKGDIDKAIEHLNVAIQVRPMPELEEARNRLYEAKGRSAIVYGVKALVNDLIRHGDIITLAKLPDVLPTWMEEIPETAKILELVHLQSCSIVRENRPTMVRSAEGVEPRGRVLQLGDDFFDADDWAYSDTIACYGIMESSDIRLDEALARMEQYGDRVIVELDDTLGARRFSLQEVERAVVAPHRHINQLYKDGTKIVIDWDHIIPNPEDYRAIQFFCGPGFERWSPLTIERQGCGGSEISVAWLADALTRLGHRVAVWAEAQGIYDGVVYMRGYNPDSPCEFLISSRVPEILVSPKPCIKALWMHDVHYGPRLTPEVCEHTDAIVVLSRWHLNLILQAYPFLQQCEVIDMRNDPLTYDDNPMGDKGWEEGLNLKTSLAEEVKLENPPTIFIVCDAIRPEQFSCYSEVPKDPNRVIWMSSVDRGLEQLLWMWPKLRKSYPDLTLKVFYGWEYFDKTLHIPEQRALKDRLLKLLDQKGIEWCGRKNPTELAKELAEANYWIYPPHPFRETCCIASMECQMSGVTCIYRQNGALGETIGDRGTPIPADADLDTAADIAIKAMKLTDLDLIDRGEAWAKRHSYEDLAQRFLRIYQHCLDKKNRT